MNGTEKTFRQLYEASVAEHGGNIAISDGERRITYKQLDCISGAIACYLKSRSIAAGDTVGIYADRSIEFVAAALAVFRVGAAYTAIDGSYPVSRINYIISEADVKVVLRHPKMSGHVCAGVDVCDIDIEGLSEGQYRHFEAQQEESSAAYIIYTSGSTGQPKGAVITYGSFLNTILWQKNFYGINESDKTSWTARVSFDASLFEIWAYILSGACINITPEDLLFEPQRLINWIAENNLTICFLPTPLAESCLEADMPENLSLRYLFSGGDALRKRPKNGVKFRMFDHYGPSECAIVTSFAEIMPQEDNIVYANIGKPIDGVEMYILNDDMKEAGDGEIGEIYISGKGVGAGYLNNKELSEHYFVPCPFSKVKGAKMYKSGDLARKLADGSFEFHGRIDRQVKIRGHRIELGEIESLIIGSGKVVNAAVVASEGGSTQKKIAAYIVPHNGMQGKAQADVKDYLMKKLPFYMMPSQIIEIEALPISVNGKIDRLKLSQLNSAVGEQTQPSENMTVDKTESALVDIWRDVLGGATFGVDDNFFDIGGDSLKAGKAVCRIREVFNVEFSVRNIFSEPTIARLAQSLKTLQSSDNAAGNIREIERDGEIPATMGQSHILLLDSMTDNKAVCNIVGVMDIDGFIDKATFEKALKLMICRHESLRTEFYWNEQIYCQRICESLDTSMDYEDLLRVRPENKAQRADSLIRNYSHRQFDVECAPLYKFALIRLEERYYKFVIVIHHSIADGWSMGVFVRDVLAIYESVVKNTEPHLPVITTQYQDYVRWFGKWLDSKYAEKQLRYWLDYLAGGNFTLDLKCARPRAQALSFDGQRCEIVVPQELTGRIENLNSSLSATMYMTLLSAYAILLYRHSRQDDFVIGSPAANRMVPEVENLMGLFINSVSLRFHITPQTVIKDLIKDARKSSLNALENQNIPFEKVVGELNVPRDASRHPIFQHLFIYQNAHIGKIECAGMRIKFDEVGSDTAKLDLTLDLQKRDGCIEGWFEYNSELFDKDAVEGMADEFVSILDAMSICADMTIDEIAPPASAERQQSQSADDFVQIQEDMDEIAEQPVQEVDAPCFARQAQSQPNDEQAADDTQDDMRKLDYWVERLADADKRTEIYNATKDGNEAAYRPGCYEFEFAEELTQRIRCLADGEGNSLFAVISAAYALVLYQHSGQECIVIGADFTDGGGNAVQDAVGLRFDINEQMPLSEVLEQANANERGAIENQGVSFELAAEKIGIKLDSPYHPIYQYKLVFTAQDSRTDAYAPLDMVCKVEDKDGVINIAVEYNACLFNPEAIELFCEHFQDIAEVLVIEPQRQVVSMPLYCLQEPQADYEIIEEQEEEIEQEPDETVSEEFESIADMFAAAAALNPDNTAIMDSKCTLTYRQLNAITNILAAELIDAGVSGNSRVGIYAPRGAGFVACALAILKAGAAYAALDTDYPKQRLDFTVKDADISIILKVCGVDMEPFDNVAVIEADIEALLEEPEPLSNVISAVEGSDAAYVIYTSGSTGKPKGIEITHSNLVHFIKWQNYYYNITSADRASWLSRTGFDTSVSEIWPYLAVGGCVCAAPDKFILEPASLMNWLNSSGITICDLTTPLAEILIYENWPQDTSLRVLKTGGDRLRKRPPEDLPFLFVNEYGPTECTVVSTVGTVAAQSDEHTVPHIGKAISGAAVYILDENLNPVQDGQEGEICIGGNGVGRGYINLPDMTAEKFVPDKFSSLPGAKMYRSGDIGRFLPDGNIEFIGRRDFQIQLRGFRVELGEIENAIIASGKVKNAAVTAAGTGADVRIYAYIVTDNPSGQVPAGLNSYLSQNLPAYMIPSSYFLLKEMPLTANGKVDRKKLESLSQDSVCSSCGQKPRNPMEEVLVNIWSQLLGRENVGIYDNFFEIGGNSLMIIKMSNMLKSKGLTCPVEMVFQKPQIAQLAAFLDFRRVNPDTDAKWSSLVELNKGAANKRPLYFLHSTPGDILGYSHLVHKLGKEQPCYGLQSVGLKDNQLCHHSIEDMAGHYVSLITEFQPNGPYMLAGWCFGGFVAFEMARQLQSQGRETALLVFIETPALNPPLWYLPFYIDLSVNLIKLGPNKIYGYFKARMDRIRQLDNPADTIGESFDVQDDNEIKNIYVSNRQPVYTANLEAAKRYKPRFYNGNVMQFVAQEREMWIARGEDMGWKTLVKQIKTEKIPGNHLGILREPEVSELAKRMKAAIEQACGK